MTRRDVAAAAAVAAIAAAYLSIYATRRLPMVDEGIVWVFADEILRGRLPYRDFHCEHGPLAFYIQAGWAAVAGPGILLGRLWIVAVGSAGAAAAYAAGRAFAGPAAARAAGLAVMLGTYPYHVYASYNVYATTMGLAAVALALHAARNDRPRRWAAAGALAALVFLTKQNIGGLLGAGIGAAALLEAIRRRGAGPFGAYAAGALGALAAGAAALAALGILGAFWREAIAWPLVRVGALGAPYPLDQPARLADLLRSPSLRTLDAAAHSLSFVGVFAAPVVLAALRPSGPARALVPIALAGAFGAVHEPTTWHLAFARPWPVLAAAAALVEIGRRGRAAAAVCALVGAGFFALHAGRQALIFDGHDAEIRAERAAGIRLRALEAAWIDDMLDLLGTIPRGETLWIASNDLMYYHLIGRPLPLYSTFLEPGVLEATGRAEPLVDEIRTSNVRWVVLPRGRSAYYDLDRLEALTDHLAEAFEVVERRPLGSGGEAIVYRRAEISSAR